MVVQLPEVTLYSVLSSRSRIQNSFSLTRASQKFRNDRSFQTPLSMRRFLYSWPIVSFGQGPGISLRTGDFFINYPLYRNPVLLTLNGGIFNSQSLQQLSCYLLLPHLALKLLTDKQVCSCHLRGGNTHTRFQIRPLCLCSPQSTFRY